MMTSWRGLCKKSAPPCPVGPPHLLHHSVWPVFHPTSRPGAPAQNKRKSVTLWTLCSFSKIWSFKHYPKRREKDMWFSLVRPEQPLSADRCRMPWLSSAAATTPATCLNSHGVVTAPDCCISRVLSKTRHCSLSRDDVNLSEFDKVTGGKPCFKAQRRWKSHLPCGPNWCMQKHAKPTSSSVLAKDTDCSQSQNRTCAVPSDSSSRKTIPSQPQASAKRSSHFSAWGDSQHWHVGTSAGNANSSKSCRVFAASDCILAGITRNPGWSFSYLLRVRFLRWCLHDCKP